jgi:hypothetical protein
MTFGESKNVGKKQPQKKSGFFYSYMLIVNFYLLYLSNNLKRNKICQDQRMMR